MENIERFHLLASTDKLNGFVYHRTDGKGCTAASVTIKFGEHHTIKVQTTVEFLSGVHRILSGHGIDHKERFVWIGGFSHRSNLVHQRLINSQTTSGVHDHSVIALGFCFLDGSKRNFHRIFFLQIEVDGHVYLLSQHAQLLDSSGTIGVAGSQQRTAVLLCLQEEGEFTRKCGLTRTIQSCHKDDTRTIFQLEVGAFTSHQCRQLIVYNFHHKLRRLQCRQHVLPKGFLLHSVGESLCHLVVDVGIKKRTAHILKSFGYIDFGDFAFTFEYFEGAFESFAEIVKHVCGVL